MMNRVFITVSGDDEEGFTIITRFYAQRVSMGRHETRVGIVGAVAFWGSQSG